MMVEKNVGNGVFSDRPCRFGRKSCRVYETHHAVINESAWRSFFPGPFSCSGRLGHPSTHHMIRLKQQRGGAYVSKIKQPISGLMVNFDYCNMLLTVYCICLVLPRARRPPFPLQLLACFARRVCLFMLLFCPCVDQLLSDLVLLPVYESFSFARGF